MGYIIVWRNSQTEPQIDTRLDDYKEEYSSYDEAKEAAESHVRVAQGPNRKNYTDYAIYQEVTS
jgi:hypothetical protein